MAIFGNAFSILFNIAGWILDMTGFYLSALYLGGTGLVVGALMMIIPWKCLKHSPLNGALTAEDNTTRSQRRPAIWIILMTEGKRRHSHFSPENSPMPAIFG